VLNGKVPPARRGPAPTELAAYIALARAKIQQGDIAAARRLLEEPQTVMRGRLGSCSLKPTIPRCWPAGESLGSSRSTEEASYSLLWLPRTRGDDPYDHIRQTQIWPRHPRTRGGWPSSRMAPLRVHVLPHARERPVVYSSLSGLPHARDWSRPVRGPSCPTQVHRSRE
jgi:hypothetical protein